MDDGDGEDEMLDGDPKTEDEDDVRDDRIKDLLVHSILNYLRWNLVNLSGRFDNMSSHKFDSNLYWNYYLPDVAAISYPISELAKSQIPWGGACGFCGGPPAVVGGAIEDKQNNYRILVNLTRPQNLPAPWI